MKKKRWQAKKIALPSVCLPESVAPFGAPFSWGSLQILHPAVLPLPESFRAMRLIARFPFGLRFKTNVSRRLAVFGVELPILYHGLRP